MLTMLYNYIYDLSEEHAEHLIKELTKAGLIGIFIVEKHEVVFLVGLCAYPQVGETLEKLQKEYKENLKAIPLWEVTVKGVRADGLYWGWK